MKDINIEKSDLLIVLAVIVVLLIIYGVLKLFYSVPS